MFNLKKITLREYLQLPEEEAEKYIQLQKVLNPRNQYGKKKAQPLGTYQFKQVRRIQAVLSEPTLEGIEEIFTFVFEVDKDQFLKASIIDYFYAVNFLSQEILKLLRTEAKVLTSRPDPDLEAAGVKKLAVFEDYPAILRIAKDYSVDPDVVETWTYNKVFTILAHDKVVGDIRHDLAEIQKSRIPKAKR